MVHKQLKTVTYCSSLRMKKRASLLIFPYLFDQVHGATPLLSVFSAEWQSGVAVTDGEIATQAVVSVPGNITPLEPEGVGGTGRIHFVLQ